MRKGQTTPPEVRLKQSLAHRGDKNPMFGRKASDTQKEAARLASLGNKYAKGYHHTQEALEKIRQASLGRRHTEESKRKIAESHKGELSYAWRGAEVGYFGVHKWLYKEAGKASRCDFADATCKGQFEWSNKSNEYRRDLEDWQQLCRSHHRKYDNSVKNFKRESVDD